VDSWFTVLRNARDADAGLVPKLDSLLLAWGADIPISRADVFQSLRERLRRAACRQSCELIDVATNLRETRWRETDWPRLSHGSLLIALAHFAGAFRRLLIPSSVTYDYGPGWGSHPVTDPLLSSRAMDVIYDGADTGRLDKIALLCESPIALGTLRVCWRHGNDENCGRCMKCVRTMVALELNGALSRCSTFPATRVDPDLLSRIRCKSPRDYRVVRNLAQAAASSGRPDMVRALHAASDRSLPHSLALSVLARLNHLGLRCATRIRARLEEGHIYN
jgi:hypothetical protein